MACHPLEVYKQISDVVFGDFSTNTEQTPICKKFTN